MLKTPEKILVIRYRFIGDTLLTVPFLRNLRKANPKAQIDMLVAPVSGEIIDKCPYVDNFLYFDTTRKHRYENSNQEKKNFRYYVKLLREKKYDKAYVLKRSFSSAFLAFCAGIPERIGFDTECRGFLLTKRVKYDNSKHEIDCFLDVLKADGVKECDNYLENWIEPEEEAKVRDYLKAKLPDFGKKRVLVHATSGNHNKEWPKDRFARIVEYLTNEKGAQVIYAGTKNDSATYESIHSFINQELKTQPLNLCGEFSLRESLALTKMCDLIVGCDSGNLHIASSVKTPVIGIYGPMDEKKWGAWGENNKLLTADCSCRPCALKKKCKNEHACLSGIDVEAVKSAIDKML